MAHRAPRAELTLLMPLALVMLAVISGATLFAYRQTVDALLEERRQEADLLARSVATRLASQGPLLPEVVRSWVPQATQVLVSEGHHGSAVTDTAVAGQASYLWGQRSFAVRVELDASRLLARQQTLRRWAPALIVVDTAILALALLALRRLLRPLSELVEQNRPDVAQFGNLEDEIVALVTDLNEEAERERKERLAKSLSQLGEMASGVAHEMRNSLATLRGYLGLIERDPRGEKLPAFLAEIRHESDQLQRVLDDFLAFARPGDNLETQVDLRELVQRVVQDPAFAERVALDAPAGDWQIAGDGQLLERALRNILRNAAEAQERAGRPHLPLEVTMARTDTHLEIRVADRGTGLPPALRAKLFQPFATGHAQGVGLGLALSRRIVVLHGGQITLDDREGGGTVACLAFPLSRAVKNVTTGNNPSRETRH